MELKDVHAELQKSFKDLQDAITKGETEQKKFGDMAVETKGLIDRINTRMDTLEAAANKKSVSASEKTDEALSPEMKAMEKFIRHGVKGNYESRLSAEEKQAFQASQTKALSAGTDAQGGIFAPEDFRLQIVKKIPNFSNVGALCNRQVTSKDVMRWPTIPYTTDDISTSGVTVTYEDETDSATETDFTMGSVAIPMRKARALIKVPVELLEDSSVDVIGLLSDLLAEAFGVDEDAKLSNGAGGKQPEGFNTNGDITLIVNGHATTLQYDGLMDFVYGLPEQYAQNSKIMVKRSFVRDLRKLKDTTNMPLWQPSLTVGAPSTFAGTPVVTNEHMPAIASGAKPAIHADFKKLMTIGDRVGMTVKRLDELYAATDQVGFLARRRWGSKVVGYWAGRKLHMST